MAKLVALRGINGFGFGFVLPALAAAVAVLPLGYIVVALVRRLIRRRDHDVLPDILWAMAALPVGLAGLLTAGIFLFSGF
ncbi:hypothetical protein [Amycolatopsis sp. lyj-108]|uniref:hypothetical protein n=1 Tax=Amycolatopsis sp. lyj-108 TaxID=2789286 RepID=UPI00397A67E4